MKSTSGSFVTPRGATVYYGGAAGRGSFGRWAAGGIGVDSQSDGVIDKAVAGGFGAGPQGAVAGGAFAGPGAVGAGAIATNGETAKVWSRMVEG